MIRQLFLFTLLILPLPALAEPLVADMSTYRIDMDAHFSGTSIFLFGARDKAGDVVMVIRGPARDYLLRKKERVAGVWLNTSRMKFFGVPSFYAVAASKPLSEIGGADTLHRLKIGEESLLPGSGVNVLTNYTEYSKAFLNYQQTKNYYAQHIGSVQFMGDTLFKTAIEFPDNLPPGQYKAEIYLINSGKIIGQQVLPLAVNKTGLDAWLYAYAHEWPVWYGLSAVIIALTAGWFAGRLFEKI